MTGWVRYRRGAVVIALGVALNVAAPGLSPASALAVGTPAAGAPAAHKVTYINACPARKKLGYMQCLALLRTDIRPVSEKVLAATPNLTPAGYSPSQLQSAYNLAAASASGGSGQTVAIVDAYDDPNAESDLAVYRSQFGLPACTTANGCFRKVNQNGAASPLPSPATAADRWAFEISIDLDTVSAICPNCHILLVEANIPDNVSLGTAENTAVNLGARFVSNSYGTSTFGPTQAAAWDAAYYHHPGVVIAAASGDIGMIPEYPAASPDVTAVGGTSLVTAANARGWNESVWMTSASEAAGSGCIYGLKPIWQTDIGCRFRSYADVSADADPATGTAVYDSFDLGGWTVGGGTSLATPIIASVYALAGTPLWGSNPASYPYTHTATLYDVTSGANASSCTPAYLCHAETGYDGPTGLGTPDGTTAFTPSIGNTMTVVYPGRQVAIAGTTANLLITARDSSGTLAQTYTATGLPPGLSIGATTGRISGTPTTAGTFSVDVGAVGADGTTGSTMFTWTVRGSADRVVVTNPGPRGGVTGAAVSLPIQASDSAAGQTLSYAATGLPSGLSINPSTGLITGTPTTTGLNEVTVTVTDGTGAAGSAAFGWTFGSPGSGNTIGTIKPVSQIGTVGTAAALQIQAGDSDPTRALSYLAINLPPGLTINSSTGLISGTLTGAVTTHFSVQVTDGTGASAIIPIVTWTVSANTVTVTSPGNQAGPVGVAVQFPVTATDSDPGEVFIYTAAGLPAGLNLNPRTGVISMTPTAAGTYSVTVTATDQTGASGSTSFTWTVNAPQHTVTVTWPSNHIGTQGAPISVQIQASSSQNLPMTYTAAGLPPGLSINSSTGLISGTPTTPGSYIVNVSVFDSALGNGSAIFTWGIGIPGGNLIPVYTPGNQGGTVGASLTLPIQASDSDPSQTLTFAAGGLPPGLWIDPATGVISGVPSTPGIYSVDVAVTDTTGVASQDIIFTWTIGNPGGNTVVVAQPRNMSWPVGFRPDGVVQILAGDTDQAQYLNYTATGLPPGVAVDPLTGAVTGTLTTAGTYTVRETATDTTGATGSASFTWTVTP